MSVPKIGLVVGTRPNLVKAAAVLQGLAGVGVKPTLIHTGQHHDASLNDVFFEALGIPPPDHHLGVKPGSRGEQLGELVRRLSELLPTLRLDELIVVGDVTSTAAGALAADACDLKLSHVEAGLRSFDWAMPEERNRRIVDAIATRLFVSEPSGITNLQREGHSPAKVHLVGNVMIDTLTRFKQRALALAPWQRLGLAPGEYAVATLHRPSNVDEGEPLKECLEILSEAGRRGPVLFSMHPRTRSRMETFGLRMPSNVTAIEPLGYLDFIGLMARARVVITDSGGAQEETTALGVPCLTIRENTERPITVEQGTSRLVGRDLNRVRASLGDLDSGTWSKGSAISLWDGRAGERIARVIVGT